MNEKRDRSGAELLQGQDSDSMEVSQKSQSQGQVKKRSKSCCGCIRIRGRMGVSNILMLSSTDGTEDM